MTAKYAVYPQTIASKNDGGWHFISASVLMHLYGVRPEECLVVHTKDFGDPSKRDLIEQATKLIMLKPRYSGDYTLPTK